MAERYYFDHNSCTPVDARVVDRFLAVELAHPANAGSLHAAGRRARGVVEEARCSVADTLGVDPDHVFFVSGGTEANHLMKLSFLNAFVEHVLAHHEGALG